MLACRCGQPIEPLEKLLRAITRTILAATLFLACVGCDQATKGVVRAHLPLGEGQSFLGDTVRLTHAENSGAFLNLGESLPDHMKSIIFIIGVGLISLGALMAAFFSRGLGRWQVVALSLIASGGIGNWIDRLTNDGRVTDFLNVGIGGLRTGIFNVADVALVVGVALYFFAGRSVQINHSTTQKESSMQRPGILFVISVFLLSAASPLLEAKDKLPWAFNGARAEGYSIDLVSVEPAPGTPLISGTTVDFKITLTYAMSVAKKGKVLLVFQDDKDRSAKPEGPMVSQSVTEPTGTVSLVDKITIPKGAKELRLFVPLAPEGLNETSGEVTIRYPIKKK